MTLSMKLKWKNPDASQDINTRLKDVFAKGFLPWQPGSTSLAGAAITPVPAVLQVTVSPFVLVNWDGAVVLSDTTETLTVSDGQINYVVCRARYRLLDTPILQLQVMTQAAYLGDPELNWLHVVGVVDLSVGGPYSSVPTSRIFYENRHAIDQNARSSWRESVATAGLLPVPPADHNRQGDVRLVTSTGSLYWWNDSTNLWEVFDEVPVITHRDHEHTNGITGDSSTGTLLPGVSGSGATSAMTVAAVSASSGYVVNGRFLQIPAAPNTTQASTVGSSRGLIRASTDEFGTITYSYRAYSGTSNIDYARIVNMSDAHPAGLFSLLWDNAAGALSWDNGPQVVAPIAPSGARRYRLYRPNGIDWIEVVALNAPVTPGATVTDNYTVNAPTDLETNFLVAYWFWDGSGAKPLIVGEDKRRFGNLAFPQMGTEFKSTEFFARDTEVLGNMVYSGGECSALTGLNLRIKGPIVAHVAGKRFETAGYSSGLAFPASSTRYVYVDDQGVLQVSATNPATVFDANGRTIQYAEVAYIVTSGVGFTTIEDRRVVLQPFNTAPSVFGAVHDGQRATFWGYGVESGCVASIGAGTSVNVSAGFFYDAFGRRVTLAAPVNVPITGPIANRVYAVVWDPTAAGSGAFKSVDLTAGGGSCNSYDLPFAIAILNGTATIVATLESTRRTAGGNFQQGYVTVGVDGNFPTLRSAMLYVMCFDTTDPHAAREIRVIGPITEPNTPVEGACIKIDDSIGFPWAQPRRFDGLRITGEVKGTDAAFEQVTWTSTTGPLIDFNTYYTDVTGVTVQNLSFVATGTASITDHARVLFRNIGRGFLMSDCSISGSNILSHLVSWRTSSVSFGGTDGVNAATVFQRVAAYACVDNGAEGLFYFGDATGANNAQVTVVTGVLTFTDCNFVCGAADVVNSFLYSDVEADTNTVGLSVLLRGSTIDRANSVFNQCQYAHKQFSDGILKDIGVFAANYDANANYLGSIHGTRFTGTSVGLAGAKGVVSCSMSTGCTVTVHASNRLEGCVLTSGTVTGGVGAIVNSALNLGVTGVLTAAAPTTTSAREPSIINSVLQKENDNANSNTMLQLTSATSRCTVTSTEFVYLNSGITATQPVISVTGSSAHIVMNDCHVDTSSSRLSMTYVVALTATGNFYLSTESCSIGAALGLLQVSRAAASTAGGVRLVDNRLTSAGTTVLDIQNSTSGQIDSVQITDNYFVLSGVDPVINMFHGKMTTFNDNHVYHSNGAANYSFGDALLSTDGRQEALSLSNNHFIGRSGASRIFVYCNRFKTATCASNTISVEDVTSTSAWADLLITGSSFSTLCTATGNNISCDTTGATFDANIDFTATGYTHVIVSNNNLLASSSSGDTYAYINPGSSGITEKIVFEGNTIRCTAPVSGAATIDCDINATINTSTMAVTSNTLKATAGTVVVDVFLSNAGVASVSNNTLYGSHSGTSADVAINIANCAEASLGNNALNSNNTAIISVVSSCSEATASGNSVKATTAADLILIPATMANATGNSVYTVIGPATIQAGAISTTSDSAVASGNRVWAGGGDAIVTAQARYAAAVTGNTIRGTDGYATAGTWNTGGSAMSVIGNAMRCTSDALAYCNVGIGTDHVSSIKDNTMRVGGTATALIGGGAVGSIQCNTANVAIGITNLAATTYGGGNNANI